MQTYNIYFTRWDEQNNRFVDDWTQFSVQTGSFVDMFVELTRLYNVLCSENCYDINWINAIEEAEEEDGCA